MDRYQAGGKEPAPNGAAHEDIAVRAYHKWVAGGRPAHSHLQDWLDAEAEARLLRPRPAAEVAERAGRRAVRRERGKRRLAAERAGGFILAAADTLGGAAARVIQAVCEGLGWDVGTLWLVDRRARVLRCVETWHRPEIEVQAFERDTRQRTFAPGAGTPGRVWAGEAPVWVPAVGADPDLPRAALAAREGLHATAGFPIRDGAEFLGVLDFFSREVRQPDEALVEMMTSIGSQVGQFIARRRAEKALHGHAEERRIARQIQQGLLPRAAPRLAGLQVGGRSLAADEVGGDCFDFLPLLAGEQESLGVLVADASGHGVGAALLAGQARAYLRALSLTCADAGALLTLANRRLAEDVAHDHFVTLLLLRLDLGNRYLAYASAGHWPGYVLDGRGNTAAVLASTGIPLGIDPAAAFAESAALPLERGGLVLVYTDGVVEAASPGGELFGLERTLGVVRAHRHEAPDEILEALFRAVSDFSEHQLHDDLTAVIIKAEGTS